MSSYRPKKNDFCPRCGARALVGCSNGALSLRTGRLIGETSRIECMACLRIIPGPGISYGKAIAQRLEETLFRLRFRPWSTVGELASWQRHEARFFSQSAVERFRHDSIREDIGRLASRGKAESRRSPDGQIQWRATP